MGHNLPREIDNLDAELLKKTRRGRKKRKRYHLVEYFTRKCEKQTSFLSASSGREFFICG